ncbi:Kynurenine 3-monooxygenase [Coccomyxa sp. Obi]|nr:Kynurenine 3-monooxygenase [Coccomyxa sp. Obi]
MCSRAYRRRELAWRHSAAAGPAEAPQLRTAENTEPHPKKDSDSSLSSESASKLDKKIVVVGAGPAGSVTAMLLAKRGYTVDVYERRARPSREQAATLHSYILALTPRGLKAIEETGADPECCSAARAPSSVGMYDMNSGRSLRMPPGRKHIVDRVTLASDLIDEALRLQGDRIRFHFGRQLQGIDLENQVATFCDAGGTKQLQATYDLLIGADGARSTVRDILQAEVPGFRAKTLFKASMCYKTFHGLPVEDYPASGTLSAESSSGQADSAVPDEVALIASHGRREFTYNWRSPKADVMVSMWKAEDGRMNGLVAATDDLAEVDQEQRLAAATPKLPAEWRRAIATQTGAEAQPPSSFGQIVRCSRFHGPRIVLIGDAAHCVTSTLGQGCISAMESCTALAATFAKCGDDLDRIPAEFTRARAPDAHAVQDLELLQVHAMVPGLHAKRLPAIMYARTLKTLALVASLLFHKLGLLPSPVYQYSAFFAGVLPVRTIKRNLHLLAAAGAGLVTLVVYGIVRFVHAAVLPAARAALLAG